MRIKAGSPAAGKKRVDWRKAIGKAVLARFKHAFLHVPAYRKFLAQNGVDGKRIVSAEDLERVPPITKKNYLRAHPWEKLSSNGALADEALVLTATSGSTGEAFYIPRTDELHEAATILHRGFLERSGLDPKKKTLVIVAFGMGVWIGGLLTYEAFRRISVRGWPLSLITPGVNKKEIFEALKHIGPAYDQLVLCGYPPFVKDVIDEGTAQKIDWKQWDMRIVCAAEAFSERFRDYLLQKTGMRDPYRSVMNIYGSAELGTMATETPLTILLRRLAIAHPPLFGRLFREAHRLPTVAQFVPDFVAFEEGRKGEVYATGGTVLPFVRYDIGDQGGTFTFDEAAAACREIGIDLEAEAARAGIGDTVTELPFVYLYERADLSTKLYGAIIYPEHVKGGLQNSQLEKSLTGRFTMRTEHDGDHNEFLELNVELKQDKKGGDALRQAIIDSVVKSLAASSDEYRYLLGSIRGKVIPRIVFWPHGDPKYFNPSIKQKWVIRS